jgi:hypothetical protein
MLFHVVLLLIFSGEGHINVSVGPIYPPDE